MNILIISYTRSGNNLILAEYLKEHLKCGLVQITEPKKRGIFKTIYELATNKRPVINPVKTDISLYDHVIFVYPVWADGVARPMKTYLESLDKQPKSYSFATMCLGTPNVETMVLKQFQEILTESPKASLVLKINNILPEKMQNTIKASITYKVKVDEMKFFDSEIKQFIESIKQEQQ